MEIYKETVNKVKFALPTSDSTVQGVTAEINGAEPISLGVTILGSSAVATLPYLSSDGKVRLVWSFTVPGSGSHTKEQTVDVVTPLVPLNEVKKIIDSNDDDEARAAEAAARHIIAAHCGQSFGKYVGKLAVTGSGDVHLRMPRRLISYNNINGNAYWKEVLALRGGGWFLQTRGPSGPPPIRADFHGYHYDANSGVIVAPHLRGYRTFAEHVEFEIDGVWGWEAVPEQVYQAAKLLINDYACGDSLYRDRFLTSMTAADWRIQFHDGAFSNTGNVRANQLLGEYVLRRGWVVV